MENGSTSNLGLMERFSIGWEGLLGLAGSFIAGFVLVLIIGDIREQPAQIEQNRTAIIEEASIRRDSDEEILKAFRTMLYNQRQIINNQTRQICRLEGRSPEECDRLRTLEVPVPELSRNGILPELDTPQR